LSTHFRPHASSLSPWPWRLGPMPAATAPRIVGSTHAWPLPTRAAGGCLHCRLRPSSLYSTANTPAASRPPSPNAGRPCKVRSRARSPSTCSTTTASCPAGRRPHPSLARRHTSSTPPRQGGGHSRFTPEARASFPPVASPGSCPTRGGCPASPLRWPPRSPILLPKLRLARLIADDLAAARQLGGGDMFLGTETLWDRPIGEEVPGAAQGGRWKRRERMMGPPVGAQ
jgi:hypothetical protein